MMNLKNLSLRYKIPLRIAALVTGTAILLSTTLVYRDSKELRNNLIGNADKMGRVIAGMLVDPMLHDDVWRVFEIIRTPFHVPQIQATQQDDEYILVLNASNIIYASTKPQQFPMLKDPSSIDPHYAELLKSMPDARSSITAVAEPRNTDKLFLLIPIHSDGLRIGTLVMSYPKSPIIKHFTTLAKDAALATVLVLLLLLPMGVYWGHKMAKPLLQLSDAMRNVTPNLPESREITVDESGDEIGQLGKAFKKMLVELKEKEHLQQHVIASDRLAAIGRLTAGIAHEINNPLGGMLNAISTYKRHGVQDALTLKTLSILERGLLQIKDTVAALLVEAKARTRPFDLNDVADICTLIQSDVERKQIDFTREIDITQAKSVSSTLVRQIIINLLLNAIHATQQRGHVHLHIYRDANCLAISIENSGSYIPEEKIAFLFEPFTPLSEAGNGLGLWVVYQIVQQLDGSIAVQSEPDSTRFTIHLPLRETYE
jgi:signal transduction histidine kinase